MGAADHITLDGGNAGCESPTIINRLMEDRNILNRNFGE
jgi:hypothetical protein